MARRKTIDEIRHELRLEKDKTRKLRKALAKAQYNIWIEAAGVASRMEDDYPIDLFPPPDGDSSPEQYSAASMRLAARRIANACRLCATKATRG